MPVAKALQLPTTHRYDYLTTYVNELDQVIDMAAIRSAGIHLGADPLGGAGVHYWQRIGERYKLNLSVVSDEVDPTFRFMTVDWDGRIRMDPSSSYAMQRLLGMKDRYDIALRLRYRPRSSRYVVTKSAGPAGQPLSAVAIDYLFQHRPLWSKAPPGRQDHRQQPAHRPC